MPDCVGRNICLGNETGKQQVHLWKNESKPLVRPRGGVNWLSQNYFGRTRHAHGALGGVGERSEKITWNASHPGYPWGEKGARFLKRRPKEVLLTPSNKIVCRYTPNKKSCKCWKNHNLSRWVHQEFLRGCQSWDDKRRLENNMGWPILERLGPFRGPDCGNFKGEKPPWSTASVYIGEMLCMEHMQIYGRGIEFYIPARCAPDENFSAAREKLSAFNLFS